MTATRDAPVERPQSESETASLSNNRIKENIAFGRETLKDIAGKKQKMIKSSRRMMMNKTIQF